MLVVEDNVDAGDTLSLLLSCMVTKSKWLAPARRPWKWPRLLGPRWCCWTSVCRGWTAIRLPNDCERAGIQERDDVCIDWLYSQRSRPPSPAGNRIRPLPDQAGAAAEAARTVQNGRITRVVRLLPAETAAPSSPTRPQGISETAHDVVFPTSNDTMRANQCFESSRIVAGWVPNSSRIRIVGRLDKEQPGGVEKSAVPGGSLTSKPTWWKACGHSVASAFFMVVGCDAAWLCPRLSRNGSQRHEPFLQLSEPNQGRARTMYAPDDAVNPEPANATSLAERVRFSIAQGRMPDCG